MATGSASQVGLSAAGALLTTLLLPVGDRGRYVLLVTVLGVTAPLAGLGSNVGLRRERPSHASPYKLEAAYFMVSLLSAAVHGLLAPAILWFATGREVPRTRAEVGLVIVLGITQVLSWQFVELWYSRLQFRTGAIYATCNAAVSFLAAAWAIVSPAFLQVIAAQAISALVLHTIQALHIRRAHAGSSPRAALTPLATSMVRIGAPSLVMTAGMSLTFRLDRLILGAQSGPQAVAIYALAGSFSELPRFIPASFGQIANGRAAAARSRLSLRPYLLPAYGWTCLGVAAAGTAGFVFMSLVNPTYRGSFKPMLVLLAAELAIVPYSITIRVILGAGRIKLSAGVGLVAIVLSGVTYWVAVARDAQMGAAWASFIVYAAVSAACIEVHRRQKD